jgi:hypothetical protein
LAFWVAGAFLVALACHRGGGKLTSFDKGLAALHPHVGVGCNSRAGEV